ncbi:MAG: CD225/dispanin family protein, partial [Oscillospiraceae bacterium]|nr:CD225/dispanin family protein [Oscillospiraceae bacterium]
MMNCKNCGAELNEGAAFCGNCGTKIEEVFEAPVTQEPVQEQGYYQAPAEPVYAEPVVPKDKPNTVLWIVLTAIEIFTCCQVTGIIGLIFAILGHTAAEKGDFETAEKKIKTAKTLFWVGLVLGLVVIVAYVILMAIGVAAGISEEM